MSNAEYLVISSSARKGSNSAFLGGNVAKGIAESASVEFIDISGLNIKGCLGCMGCIAKADKPSKGCVQKDDMQPLYPKIVAAKGIVFTFPIYWFTMNGQIKTFLDRCFAVAMSGAFTGKRFAAAFAYADQDPMCSGAVNAVRTLQDMVAYSKSTWVGCVYASADESNALAGDTALIAEAQNLGRKIAQN